MWRRRGGTKTSTEEGRGETTKRLELEEEVRRLQAQFGVLNVREEASFSLFLIYTP